MNLQVQLYIGVGVLAFLWILLSIALIVLCVKVNKLSTATLAQNQRNDFKIARPRTLNSNGSLNSFGFPEIMPGEELHNRGFSSYPEKSLAKQQNNPLKSNNNNNSSSYDQKLSAQKKPREYKSQQSSSSRATYDERRDFPPSSPSNINAPNSFLHGGNFNNPVYYGQSSKRDDPYRSNFKY